MPNEVADEHFLLVLLNTTPRVDGIPADQLADPAAARGWLQRQGGTGSPAEQRQVRAARDALQAVLRGQQPPGVLAPFLNGASSVPALTGGRVTWTLTADPDRRLAVRAVLAWDELGRLSPGRLRPCANEACRLFLLDRTKGNTARWCSMAVCGNRMKARRHYQRARTTP
ncbi:MAG TPA: CGNR zinc finger domain-containing protein [Streptosporangiaceae bacterium]|jgi:predicted RNA-binding Zn ribbon-like protein